MLLPWFRVGLVVLALLGRPSLLLAQATTGGALPVVIDTNRSGLDAARVQAAIQHELGVPLRVDTTAPQRLEVVITGRRANVTYFAAGSEPVTRSVDLPRDDERATETIAFLAGNLARDEAAALLAELRPPEAPPEPTEAPPPPPVPPPAPPAEPAQSAVPPPKKLEAPTPKPDAPSGLIEANGFAFNLSLFHPVTLLRETERRRLNLELGLAYSRVGAVRGFAFTMGYLHVAGPSKGLVCAFGWSRTGEMKGVQLGQLVAEGHGKLTGFSYGDFVNVRTGDVEGVQLATFVSLSHHVVGAQAGGIFSRTYRLEGANLAGIANVAQGKVEGAQIGGIASVAQAVDGVQLSGIASVAGDVNGVQLGLVNVGRKVHGMQLGLVNVADEIHGGALGLVNIAGNGSVQPLGWVSGGTDLSVNAGVKFVTDYTYVFTGIGKGVSQNRSRLESGAGLHLALDKAYAEFGVGYGHVNDDRHPSRDPIRHDFRYEARLGYEILRYVTPYVGGGIDQRIQGEGAPVRGEYFAGLAVF